MANQFRVSVQAGKLRGTARSLPIAAKQALMTELGRGHAPGPLKAPVFRPGFVEDVVFYLSPVEQSMLAPHLAANPLLRPRDVMAALIERATCAPGTTAASAQRSLSAEEWLGKMVAALGGVARDEQRELTRMVSAQFSATESPVILAEAPTGAGKTLAYLALAAAAIEADPDHQVVIAVPTYALMRQIQAQVQLLREGLPAFPEAVQVLSMREYVDVGRLRELLNDLAEDVPGAEAAAAWLEAGGPSPVEDSPDRWLVSSLLELAPEFDVSEVVLDETRVADDEGYLAYAAQHEPRRGRLVLCTHAKIAVDASTIQRLAKRNLRTERALNEVEDVPIKGSSFNDTLAPHADLVKGFFPSMTHLIIDEAHLFEATVSNMCGRQLHLRQVLQDIRALMQAGMLPRAAAEDAAQLCQALDREVRRGMGATGAPSAELEAVVGPLKALQLIIRSRQSGGRRISARLRQVRQRLVMATDLMEMAITSLTNPQGGGIRATLRPAQHAAPPVIAIEAPNIGFMLDLYWRRVPIVVLCSGTLYVKSSKSGGYSARLIAQQLRLPTARMQELPPIRAGWVTSPVTVWRPSGARRSDGSYFLMPASKGDHHGTRQQLEHEHRVEAAAVVKREVMRHEGSALVLCTSFKDVEHMADLLADSLGPRLVVMRPGHLGSLRVIKTTFMQKLIAGERPILLATGAAWTGLDLDDPSLDADDPRGLRLLFITRLPFGLVQSRTSRNLLAGGSTTTQVTTLVSEATLLLRQGLGRLIRRPGLAPCRHAFILDARILAARDGVSSFQGGMAHLMRLTLADYPRQLPIEPIPGHTVKKEKSLQPAALAGRKVEKPAARKNRSRSGKRFVS